jgi:glycosyltransferase involved in cell wall biosynthesis
MPKISVVVPVYNEAEGVYRFHIRLSQVIKKTRHKYEIIYVNDGSNDNSFKELTRIRSQDTKVKLINLSRNFGKEAALTAGIKHAKGELVITIDSDGQHPPELIPEFIKKALNFDMVVGVRSRYEEEGLKKKALSRLYYWVARKAGVQSLRKNGTDFRIFNKVVADSFLEMTERSRMVRGMFDWIGFEVAEIEFTAPDRIAGEAQYSFKKLAKLAIDGITGEGILPLYFSLITSVFIVLSSSGLLIFLIIEDLLLRDVLSINPSGSAYLIIVALLLIGIVILFQGISSLFIARIHNETLARPLYVIKDIIE